MIKIRPSSERGKTRAGWLDSSHTFSFNRYYDPQYSGFRSLLVINEDHVAPGAGFGTHSHDNMEILSYVVAGALMHRDSSGGSGVIRPGELQRMSAGTGVSHSEFNASKTEPVNFLQIWITPEREGLRPGYEHQQNRSDAAGLCDAAEILSKRDAVPAIRGRGSIDGRWLPRQTSKGQT